MTITLSVGGYTIELQERHDYPLLAWPLRPFEAFAAQPDALPDIRVTVQIPSVLPELKNPRLRFDGGDGLWRLFDTDAGLALESLDTATRQPRARALVSDDFREVHASILPAMLGAQVGWCPMYLFNPIVEAVFLTRLARDGGLLLHAAGLSLGTLGYVFSGPSGAGKSTLAQFFADRQAVVLSDERLVLRSDGESPMVYGTPWVGSGNYAANASVALSAWYLIRHGIDRHRIDRMPRAAIASRILQQSFLPHWDRLGMERTLDFLLACLERVPCQSLEFLKDPGIVDVITQCEQRPIPA